MVQQSWPKVWVKKEHRSPKKNMSRNVPKPKQLAEQLAAGLAEVNDQCTYSRDLLLKNFTPEKADLTSTATASTPTAEVSTPATTADSKDSSLASSPPPPALSLSEHVNFGDSIGVYTDWQGDNEQQLECANQVTEHYFNWPGEFTYDPSVSWNDTFGNEMMSQLPIIPDFPVTDVSTSLPLEQLVGKKSKRKAGKGSTAEAGGKAGTKSAGPAETKANVKAVAAEGGKAGSKGGSKTGTKSRSKKTEVLAVAGLIAKDAGKANEKGAGKSGMKSGTKKGDMQSIAELAAQDIAMPLTTLMLRNIPNECTRDCLFEHLEKTEFQGKVDFVYLPVNFSTDRNFGYSFLNFRTAEAAAAFMEAYNGAQVSKCLPMFKSDKVCKVVPAAIQGWEANMRKLCGSSYAVKAHGPERWHPLFLDAVGQKVEVMSGNSQQRSKKAFNPDASEFVPDSLTPNVSEFVPESLTADMNGYGPDSCYSVPGYGPDSCYSAGAEFMQPDFSEPMVSNQVEYDEWSLLLAGIQVQVEYYFSKPNLEKDFYLKSLMDEDGWVQISDLAQFNRMKQMQADVNTLAAAMGPSMFVELSPDGQRIRARPGEATVLPDVAPVIAPEWSPS